MRTRGLLVSFISSGVSVSGCGGIAYELSSAAVDAVDAGECFCGQGGGVGRLCSCCSGAVPVFFVWGLHAFALIFSGWFLERGFAKNGRNLMVFSSQAMVKCAVNVVSELHFFGL